MAIYRKVEIVEAAQYNGAPLTVMHDHLGEQKAQPGDWLLGTERGKIRVMSAKQFEAEFKPYAAPDSSPDSEKAHLNNRLSELTAEIAFLDLARSNLEASRANLEAALKDARAEIADLRKQLADNTEVLREHPLRKSETPAKEAWQQSHAKTAAKKRTKRT